MPWLLPLMLLAVCMASGLAALAVIAAGTVLHGALEPITRRYSVVSWTGPPPWSSP